MLSNFEEKAITIGCFSVAPKTEKSKPLSLLRLKWETKKQYMGLFVAPNKCSKSNEILTTLKPALFGDKRWIIYNLGFQ